MARARVVVVVVVAGVVLVAILATIALSGGGDNSTHPPTPTPAPTPSPPPPPGSPVALHGQLSVNGNRIVNELGQAVRLRGMVLFWSQWMGKFWNDDVVQWLAKDWHVSVIRAAMGVEEGGYLTNPQREKAKVEAVVQAAIKAGIYVIIDWHDHHGYDHLTQSTTFFKEMAKTYGSLKNVLFEDFNEPLAVGWHDQVKPYHTSIVEVIRQHTQNIIILGTTTWSQDVDTAASDPVPGTNLAYTVHFYAASHKQALRDKVQAALDKGVAVFATEWGTCDASGDGALDLDEARTWLDFLEKNHISDANWAISDKSESCSALEKGAATSGGWLTTQLTESGNFVRNSLRSSASTSYKDDDRKQMRNETSERFSYV